MKGPKRRRGVNHWEREIPENSFQEEQQQKAVASQSKLLVFVCLLFLATLVLGVLSAKNPRGAKIPEGPAVSLTGKPHRAAIQCSCRKQPFTLPSACSHSHFLQCAAIHSSCREQSFTLQRAAIHSSCR
eukprot:1153959-Pelagomonas_calceolata.AAC.2